MTLKANQESTDENASTEKSDSDVNSKDFTCEQAQAINSIKVEFILSDKKNKFHFTASKMEKQFNFEYHHWADNKKVVEKINKCEKSPETLRVIETRKKITEPGNLRFNFDSELKRKLWVPRRPDKRRRDEVAELTWNFVSGTKKKNRRSWI